LIFFNWLNVLPERLKRKVENREAKTKPMIIELIMGFVS